jgi:hypothetical protein
MESETKAAANSREDLDEGEDHYQLFGARSDLIDG